VDLQSLYDTQTRRMKDEIVEITTKRDEANDRITQVEKTLDERKTFIDDCISTREAEAKIAKDLMLIIKLQKWWRCVLAARKSARNRRSEKSTAKKTAKHVKLNVPQKSNVKKHNPAKC